MKEQEKSPEQFRPLSEEELAWETKTPERREIINRAQAIEDAISPEEKAEQRRLAAEAAEEGRKKYGQMLD